MAMAFYGFFVNVQQRNGFYEAVVQKARQDPDTTIWGVWDSLEKLMKGLKDHCVEWLPTTQCPLLISIDEVHVLYSQRRVDIRSNHTLYSRMTSVLNEGVNHDLEVIILSTANHISSIAPSKQTAPSMREREEGRILPAPFTELPFDVHIIDQPLISGQATLASAGSLEFTAKFGRPLFYSSYLSRQGQSNIVNGIMRNVREKLSGRPWPPAAQTITIDASSIAILSARLLIDLSPTTAHAMPYEEELVRNHLRMLYSVHENRQTLVTGSSPEPLIAEASAQIMNHYLANKTIYEFMGSVRAIC